MARLRDISGQRFGRLTAIKRVPNLRANATRWQFVCDCGVVKDADMVNVVHGSTKSCGCLNTETVISQGTHRKTNTKVYKAWQAMRYRCAAKHKDREYYFDKGIKVDPLWDSSFEEFYRYVGDPPTSAHTLDRIDSTKGYEPGNMRWATWEEQQNNRASYNVKVETPEGTLTIAQALREFGIPKSSFYKLRREGMSSENIIVKYVQLAQERNQDDI